MKLLILLKNFKVFNIFYGQRKLKKNMGLLELLINELGIEGMVV